MVMTWITKGSCEGRSVKGNDCKGDKVMVRRE